MWRHIASNAITLLIVLVFLLGGLILWGQSEYKAEGPLDTQICLRVERGTNVSRVSRKLEDQGAITSGTLFRLGMDYADQTAKLKAGSYLVPEHSSMSQIAEIITRGGASTCGTEVVYRIGIVRDRVEVRELDPATSAYVEKADFVMGEDETPAEYTRVREQGDTRYRIAMAEGVTTWQVVEALKAFDVLKGEITEVPPEGMLAPSNYEVRPGDDRQALIDQMRDAQEKILAAAWEGRDPDLPLASPEEVLILASIIEKETGVPTERYEVASVFVNRLRKGMRLQTDPTVIYGITKGQRILGRGLRQSELRKATPYNTYVIEGLPPGPIANPGRESIEAAVHPEDTDYIFFVAKTLNPRDGHAFATTLDEHNANVRRYREAEANQ
ncbi:endolytic transglycosylase MltG [Rhodalgimonas zhirmunskyi]|uniref:Endolytic murein transglycosylase n=1 Tax=Rhodalgimonas zhirmunskyi TaxID=2964767 RepID=A0AAJ1X5H7_9RHOB|nr:endolytic transglycosylase MltG [Rhodoalgimonas zhirmunskyi]MDQ2095258.1 endolytic transglycosylase MltG [Rhodoalgimonas zhirmunskyi]